jgi:hypothetical protein
MLPYRSALVLGLLALSFAPPQDTERPEGRSLASFRAEERERLERELDGAWSLLSFTTDEGDVDPRDVRGFTTFHAGYMTLILQGREEVLRILRGPAPAYTIQGGAFHYRIGENLALQTASVLGFSNANREGTLEFEASNAVREYALRLEEDELQLSREPGITFVFRRMPPGEFPKAAIDALDRSRSGPADPRARGG